MYVPLVNEQCTFANTDPPPVNATPSAGAVASFTDARQGVPVVAVQVGNADVKTGVVATEVKRVRFPS